MLTESERDVDFPEEVLDHLMAKEKERNNSNALPPSATLIVKTLPNQRASQIVSHPRTGSVSGSKSPPSSPSSPRIRTTSNAVPRRDSGPTISTIPSLDLKKATPPPVTPSHTEGEVTTSTSEVKLESQRTHVSTEEDGLDEETAQALAKDEEDMAVMQTKKKFISDTLRNRYRSKRMTVGEHTFIDLKADFCVTETNSCTNTPPPERLLSERFTHTQYATIQNNYTLLNGRISGLEKSIANINNSLYVLQHPPPDQSSQCSLCSLF